MTEPIASPPPSKWTTPAPAMAAPYRAFFLGGIAVVLTVGAAWGVWLLWQIGLSHRFTGASLHHVNAHGHAQVFGWIGLFVMGFGYQMFPALWQRRLHGARAVPFVCTAMLAGLIIHTSAMTATGKAWAAPALLLGGALEIAAILTFAIQMGLSWRASLARNQPYLRFIGAALLFFVVQAVFSLWHGFKTMTAPDHQALIQQVATYQAVLRDLQIHGFILFMVLGVSIQVLPRFFGLTPVTAARARRAWWLLCAGVLGEVTLFLLYRATAHHIWAAALLLPWIMLAIGALSLAASFRPWRPFPRPAHAAKFVRMAYAWLALSFVLLLLLPLYQVASRLSFSHAYYGSIRHAITVGFASQMIMGIAGHVVPNLRQVPSGSLRALRGPFVLLNLGCLLRVTLQALTDFHSGAFAIVGVSGILELAALSWWGAYVVGLMVTSPSRMERPVASAG